jgi:hypothetical protein
MLALTHDALPEPFPRFASITDFAAASIGISPLDIFNSLASLALCPSMCAGELVQ